MPEDFEKAMITISDTGSDKIEELQKLNRKAIYHRVPVSQYPGHLVSHVFD